MRSVVWKEGCCGCGLHGTYSRIMINVWMALEMSIVDLCLVRVMCGLMKWLQRWTPSQRSSGWNLFAYMIVVQKR